MIRSLRRLTRLFLLAFVLIAGGLGYWGLISQTALTTRQDNPRAVLAEQQVQQGEIVDRDDRVLVESTPIQSGQNTYTRSTLYPETAAVVGFYSLRHGTGGIESVFQTTLHGDRFISPFDGWLNGLLHRRQVGGDVRMTLSLPIQQAAREALNGRRGAIVIMNAANGDILAMDSLPTYDPNTLDEKWDSLRADPAAPLLNRATQALYQPGSVLQGVILGEAINTGAAKPSDPRTGPSSAQFLNGVLPCAMDPGIPLPTYADAFVWGCPGPLQALGGLMGLADLQRGFSDFGLAEAPRFDLPVASAQNRPQTDDAANTAIGQGQLTVTPLHMALVAAAFANHGQMPAPRLVSAIRPPGQGWAPMATLATPRGTISGDSADAVKSLMRDSVISGAALAASQPQREIYGHTGLALAGPGPAFNTWFVGFTYTDSRTPLVIAVLLEDTRDAATASHIGGLLLAEAAALADK